MEKNELKRDINEFLFRTLNEDITLKEMEEMAIQIYDLLESKSRR